MKETGEGTRHTHTPKIGQYTYPFQYWAVDCMQASTQNQIMRRKILIADLQINLYAQRNLH